MASELGGRSGRLTAIAVAQRNKPGRYPDGLGLYLQVTTTLTKSWLFRFMLDYRARWIGLGPYPEISLAEARKRRNQARRLLIDGVDPIEARRRAHTEARLAAAKAVSFTSGLGH